MKEFEDELRSWYEGEIAGAAFFDALARATRDDGEAEKWRVLGSLESAMAERLSATCAARSITLPETASTSSYLDQARKMASESWRTNMEGLVPQLEVAVAEIRAAASQAPTNFAEVAEDFIAHEEALLAFANAELKGEDGTPVIESLLERWSQGPVGATQGVGRDGQWRGKSNG